MPIFGLITDQWTLPTNPSTDCLLFQSSGFLCCCGHNSAEVSPSHEQPIDKILIAFEKFDTDGDGYIDWDEFQEVS